MPHCSCYLVAYTRSKTEVPEEVKFVCVMEKPQQNGKVELRFQIKFGQQLLTHVLSMREAAQSVQPNLSQSMVTYFVTLFFKRNR